MRIISGGQSGVDRAALDAARALGLPYGGFVPQGRWTEDGPLSADYAGMEETHSADPARRTKRNIALADATLVITRGPPDGGTLLTLRTAGARGKPLLHVDLGETDPAAAAAAIREWLVMTRPETLNVAGPRESKAPGIQSDAETLLRAVFLKATD